MKTAGIVVATVALLVAAFWGGTYYAGLDEATTAQSQVAPGDGAGLGPGAGGGPMADLTEEERTELENMTAEDRQEFLAERMGVDPTEMPTGGGMRGFGGGTVDGTVLEVADDTITVELEDGGSQTLYTDSDTVIAHTESASDLGVGSDVMVIVEPEADGVTMARAVVVR